MFSIVKTVFKIIPILFALFCFPASGASSSDEAIRDAREEAERVKRKIEKAEHKIQTYTEKEKRYIDALDKVGRNLNRIQRKTAALKSEISSLDHQIGKAQRELETVRTEIADNETYAAKRLVALYKLTRIGKVQILASADSVNDYFRRKTAVEEILAHDMKLISTLEEQYRRLGTLISSLEKNKNRQASLQKEYKNRRSDLETKKSNRSNLLAAVRKDKSLAMLSAKSLKITQADLNQKIKGLTLKAKQERPVKKAAEKISSHTGLLKMPVKGKVISEFGPYKNTEFDIVNFRSGIDIEADMGEPIRAVKFGKVLFSNWFKGYGNLIIIDHGDSYYTLYAHARELYKTEGDRVETDEVIGTVGDTGTMDGAKLHFEVRHHGNPIDPIKWLKQG